LNGYLVGKGNTVQLKDNDKVSVSYSSDGDIKKQTFIFNNQFDGTLRSWRKR